MIEDRNTEFRGVYSDSLVKTAIAFSNGTGGRIFIGIDDDGKVCGLDDADDACKKCIQAGAYRSLRNRTSEDHGCIRGMPSVVSSTSTFTITLPATDSASDTEMYRFLTKGREFTHRELQDALGLNRTGAVSRLSGLVDSGKIVRIGKGRGTRYRVV